MPATVQHNYVKREQYAYYKLLKDNLGTNEILLHLDYSENYNKLRSRVLTLDRNRLACGYFRNFFPGEVQKIPMTVTSEANDKSRTAEISCVDVVLKHVLLKVEHEVDTRHIFSDGCAAQFRSRNVFNLLIYI